MASAMKQTITLMLLMAACIGTAKAATYIVGDKTGWTIPTSASFYPNWAAKQTFQVGDTLVFNFPKGAHTVGEVSKASFDSCSTNNVISAVKATAPANYTLSSAGTHYFICTIIGHCSAGQKLAVTVTGPSSSAPATAPSTSPAPSPAKSTPTPSTSPAPSPAKSTPTPSAAPAPSPAKSTTPSTSPAPSPASTTSPPPAPASPAPGGGASPPSGGAAGVPPASSPSGGATPSDNFAAPIAGGFSMFSLVSMIVLALLF